MKTKNLNVTTTNGIETLSYTPKTIKIDLTEFKQDLNNSYKKQNAKASKKVLDQNAIHMSKMRIAKEITEENIKELFGATEIEGYGMGVQGYLLLDPLTGTGTMDHQLITLRVDGVIQTYTIPWQMFAICHHNLGGNVLETSEVKKTDQLGKTVKYLIDEVGISYKETKDCYKDLVIPNFGSIIKINGDPETILELDTVSFKNDGKLSTYTKFVYNGKDGKHFQVASTLYFPEPLKLACALIFENIQKAIEKQKEKDKKKQKKAEK